MKGIHKANSTSLSGRKAWSLPFLFFRRSDIARIFYVGDASHCRRFMFSNRLFSVTWYCDDGVVNTAQKCTVVFTVFIIWALFHIVEAHRLPKKYGCVKMYRAPPMWRCGYYGTAHNTDNILYTEVWVAEEKYVTWVDPDDEEINSIEKGPQWWLC